MAASTPRQNSDVRSDYARFEAITTRWMDNDSYGHVNNVVYYSFFDTAVNRILIDGGVLDVGGGCVIGLVVETQCHYFSPVRFPDQVHAGVRVETIGTSSVRYGIGLFRNDDDRASAQGHFVHVYVDRATNRPTPLSEPLRQLVSSLRRPPHEASMAGPVRR